MPRMSAASAAVMSTRTTVAVNGARGPWSVVSRQEGVALTPRVLALAVRAGADGVLPQLRAGERLLVEAHARRQGQPSLRAANHHGPHAHSTSRRDPRPGVAAG